LLVQLAVFFAYLLKRLEVSERLALAGKRFTKPLLESFPLSCIRSGWTREQSLQLGEIVLTLRKITAGSLDDKIATLHSAIEPWYYRFQRLMVLASEERGLTAE
jgi:hypothetical protein